MYFKGTFELTLDSKYRLTVPARYKSLFAEGAVIAAQPETQPGEPVCVSIFTTAGHVQFIEDTMTGLRQAGPMSRELKRFYLANAYDVDLDNANRLMIPSSLRDYAGLHCENKVMVTGVGDCLEVWNPDEYKRYTSSSFSRISELAASLDHTA